MQFKRLIPVAVALVVAACGTSDPTAPALEQVDDRLEAQAGYDIHDQGATPIDPQDPPIGECVKITPGSQLGVMFITKPAKKDGTCPGGFEPAGPQPG